MQSLDVEVLGEVPGDLGSFTTSSFTLEDSESVWLKGGADVIFKAPDREILVHWGEGRLVKGCGYQG